MGMYEIWSKHVRGLGTMNEIDILGGGARIDGSMGSWWTPSNTSRYLPTWQETRRCFLICSVRLLSVLDFMPIVSMQGKKKQFRFHSCQVKQWTIETDFFLLRSRRYTTIWLLLHFFVRSDPTIPRTPLPQLTINSLRPIRVFNNALSLHVYLGIYKYPRVGTLM